MRIFGCWICYNNIDTIAASIESVMRYVDELVVIDGDFNGNRSTDGTWEAVEYFNTIKPLWHIESKASTLYEKHNEHVKITGNNNPDVWTWQVDSDEVYNKEDAQSIYQLIGSTNNLNGVGVKLFTVNRMDEERNAYTSNDILGVDTTQMRLYRMKDGLHFQTKDGIFEDIVYADGTPVQRQDNAIAYNDKKFKVFNYHCFDTKEKVIARHEHYKADNPEAMYDAIQSEEHNQFKIEDHPLKEAK